MSVCLPLYISVSVCLSFYISVYLCLFACMSLYLSPYVCLSVYLFPSANIERISRQKLKLKRNMFVLSFLKIFNKFWSASLCLFVSFWVCLSIQLFLFLFITKGCQNKSIKWNENKVLQKVPTDRSVSLSLPGCLYVCLSLCLLATLSVYQSPCLSVSIYVCPSLSVCLSVYPFSFHWNRDTKRADFETKAQIETNKKMQIDLFLSLFLYICLFVCLSLCLWISMSIYLSALPTSVKSGILNEKISMRKHKLKRK